MPDKKKKGQGRVLRGQFSIMFSTCPLPTGHWPLFSHRPARVAAVGAAFAPGVRLRRRGFERTALRAACAAAANLLALLDVAQGLAARRLRVALRHARASARRLLVRVCVRVFRLFHLVPLSKVCEPKSAAT